MTNLFMFVLCVNQMQNANRRVMGWGKVLRPIGLPSSTPTGINHGRRRWPLLCLHKARCLSSLDGCGINELFQSGTTKTTKQWRNQKLLASLLTQSHRERNTQLIFVPKTLWTSWPSVACAPPCLHLFQCNIHIQGHLTIWSHSSHSGQSEYRVKL